MWAYERIYKHWMRQLIHSYAHVQNMVHSAACTFACTHAKSVNVIAGVLLLLWFRNSAGFTWARYEQFHAQWFFINVFYIKKPVRFCLKPRILNTLTSIWDFKKTKMKKTINWNWWPCLSLTIKKLHEIACFYACLDDEFE